MSKRPTKESIHNSAIAIFATSGYDGLSIRSLSAASGVGISSIYHFFEDKDGLLLELYLAINKELGIERRKLAERDSAIDMLRDRIDFQFKHIEKIVFILKYYLHFRQSFLATPEKILPPKAYLHVEEVIHKGISSGEFSIRNSQIDATSKIIAHSINGFLLEYYPMMPSTSERQLLVDSLTSFAVTACSQKEVPMQQ